ncbi:hypothetical protein PVAP13_8KG186602 [Panicum virgatum]|uniref:Uncharacterized protein n=1 Tax=Panicum virgatum TaxID=38727 RepID=A0A8T0PQJ6_PANVG|nr:hypothetical protein PVAP13_8KG186602 [Panicum virgatum]
MTTPPKKGKTITLGDPRCPPAAAAAARRRTTPRRPPSSASTRLCLSSARRSPPPPAGEPPVLAFRDAASLGRRRGQPRLPVRDWVDAGYDS